MLELHEVLYMPGMRVNIFSLQRIKSKGSCSYAFAGNPQPGKKIPIYNKMGERIATILENEKARPTLICEKYHGAAHLEGEVLGGKGITMELLQRRLGHISQGGLERLVREQLVRGLEAGIQGDLGCARAARWGNQVSRSTHENLRSIEHRCHWSWSTQTLQVLSTQRQ